MIDLEKCSKDRQFQPTSPVADQSLPSLQRRLSLRDKITGSSPQGRQRDSNRLYGFSILFECMGQLSLDISPNHWHESSIQARSYSKVIVQRSLGCCNRQEGCWIVRMEKQRRKEGDTSISNINAESIDWYRPSYMLVLKARKQVTYAGSSFRAAKRDFGNNASFQSASFTFNTLLQHSKVRLTLDGR